MLIPLAELGDLLGSESHVRDATCPGVAERKRETVHLRKALLPDGS